MSVFGIYNRARELSPKGRYRFLVNELRQQIVRKRRLENELREVEETISELKNYIDETGETEEVVIRRWTVKL